MHGARTRPACATESRSPTRPNVRHVDRHRAGARRPETTIRELLPTARTGSSRPSSTGRCSVLPRTARANSVCVRRPPHAGPACAHPGTAARFAPAVARALVTPTGHRGDHSDRFTHVLIVIPGIDCTGGVIRAVWEDGGAPVPKPPDAGSRRQTSTPNAAAAPNPAGAHIDERPATSAGPDTARDSAISALWLVTKRSFVDH